MNAVSQTASTHESPALGRVRASRAPVPDALSLLADALDPPVITQTNDSALDRAPAHQDPGWVGSPQPGSAPSSGVAALHLWIPGEPAAWARPRFNRTSGRVFNPGKQVAYATRVGDEWIAAGRPLLLPGAYRVSVFAFLPRPAAHYRANGELSAAGLRAPAPTRKPDASNLLKLVEDALVRCGAIPDDRFIVRAWWVEKRWAPTRADIGLQFLATSITREVAA